MKKELRYVQSCCDPDLTESSSDEDLDLAYEDRSRKMTKSSKSNPKPRITRYAPRPTVHDFWNCQAFSSGIENHSAVGLPSGPRFPVSGRGCNPGYPAWSLTSGTKATCIISCEPTRYGNLRNFSVWPLQEFFLPSVQGMVHLKPATTENIVESNTDSHNAVSR